MKTFRAFLGASGAFCSDRRADPSCLRSSPPRASSVTGRHVRLRRRHPAPAATLTELEQTALLTVTGEHRDGFRDHVIFTVVLETGLREHEIAALDVGGVRRRIALRTFKRSSTSTEPATQEVLIPNSLFYKLGK